MGDTGVTQTLARTALARATLLRRALAWLAHPVTVVAVVVLVVNDHVLKAALGTWWTGKLSDVAGMVFFPALVAVALAGAQAAFTDSASRRRPRLLLPPAAFSRLVLVSTVLTGVGFAWVKATEAGAATASALLTAITGPGVLLQDATDLLALPALALAVWAARAPAREVRDGRERARRAVGIAMVPFALLASVATSEGASAYWDQATIVANPGITQGWVLAVQGCDTYDQDPQAWCDQPRYFRIDGATWNPVSQQFAPPGGKDALPQEQSCSVEQPSLCFRMVREGVGVEESDDGGRTWDVAWRLDASKAHAAAAYYGPDTESVRTTGVGVIDTADGPVVWVANGADGLVTRGADGVWQREGFVSVPGMEHQSAAPFARGGNTWDRNAVDGLVWIVAMVVLTTPLLAEGLAWGSRRDPIWRPILAVALGLLLSAVGAIKLDSVNPGLSHAFPNLVGVGTPGVSGALALGVGYGWAVWSVGRHAVALPGLWARAFLGSALVAVATGWTAVGITSPRPADAVLVPPVALAVCAAYVVIVRAFMRRKVAMAPNDAHGSPVHHEEVAR